MEKSSAMPRELYVLFPLALLVVVIFVKMWIALGAALIYLIWML